MCHYYHIHSGTWFAPFIFPACHCGFSLALFEFLILLLAPASQVVPVKPSTRRRGEWCPWAEPLKSWHWRGGFFFICTLRHLQGVQLKWTDPISLFNLLNTQLSLSYWLSVTEEQERVGRWFDDCYQFVPPYWILPSYYHIEQVRFLYSLSMQGFTTFNRRPYWETLTEYVLTRSPPWMDLSGLKNIIKLKLWYGGMLLPYLQWFPPGSLIFSQKAWQEVDLGCKWVCECAPEMNWHPI